MGRLVKIKITAEVTTTIELAEGETLEDLKKRDIDIYLHDSPLVGAIMVDKTDLGVNDATIQIIEG